jgi:hypothetical protein
MEILIKDDNASQSSLEQNTIRWKLNYKGYKRILIVLYILGLLSLIMGFATFSEPSKSEIGEKTIYYFKLHFIESLGIVMFFSAIYLTILLIKIKNNFFKRAKEVAQTHLKNGNEIVIQFNDNGVKYSSSKLRQEIGWDLFMSYTIYDNYLFLNTYDNNLTGVAINKGLLPSEDFSLLEEFIKKRLVNKKLL